MPVTAARTQPRGRAAAVLGGAGGSAHHRRGFLAQGSGGSALGSALSLVRRGLIKQGGRRGEGCSAHDLICEVVKMFGSSCKRPGGKNKGGHSPEWLN